MACVSTNGTRSLCIYALITSFAFIFGISSCSYQNSWNLMQPFRPMMMYPRNPFQSQSEKLSQSQTSAQYSTALLQRRFQVPVSVNPDVNAPQEQPIPSLSTIQEDLATRINASENLLRSDSHCKDFDEFVSRTIAIPMMTTLLVNQTELMSQRQSLAIEQLARLGLQSKFILGTTFGGTHEINPYIFRESMKLCVNQTDKDFCFFFQDDTIFHPEFKFHFIELLASVPQRWTMVHLCPGPLSGLKRKQKASDIQKILPVSSVLQNLQKIIRDHNFTLPERRLRVWSSNTSEDHDRFYKTHPTALGSNWRITVGGPVAFVVRQEFALTLLKEHARKSQRHDDFLLANAKFTKDSFVAKQPQLCYHMSGPSVMTNSMW